MDLFRRIFGKTSEELPTTNQDDPVEDKASDAADDAEIEPEETPDDEELAETGPLDTDDSSIEGLDSTTRPVSTDSSEDSTVNADGVTQKLNPEVATSAVEHHHFMYGQSTDVGLVRNNNQDAVLSFFTSSGSVDDQPDFGLFVVADGMGGHLDGEKASAITTRQMALHVTRTVYLPMLSDDTEQRDVPPITEALVEAVKSSNQQIIEKVQDGGTTVTAVATIGDLAYVAHVGDSRAYLLTRDGIEQITRDHSLVQRLIELDQLTQEEAEAHPQKNVLYRALGQNDELEVDTVTRRLPAGSRLLICSDGLWGQVEEREIYEIAMNVDDPQEACDKLVALANTHGGVDNVTVVLLKT